MRFLNTLTVLLVVMMLVLLNGCKEKEAPKAEAEMEKPSKILDLNEVTTVTIVEDIDLPNRIFTLKYADGNLIVVEAAEDLTNIDKIKVGDKVEVTYLTSKAVYVQSPDATREPVEESTAVQVDSKDGKPRKLSVDLVEETSMVEAIDYANRTVTLKDHEGKVQTIEVKKDLENFENVKVGDQVVFQYTRAFAVNISKVEE